MSTGGCKTLPYKQTNINNNPNTNNKFLCFTGMTVILSPTYTVKMKNREDEKTR